MGNTTKIMAKVAQSNLLRELKSRGVEVPAAVDIALDHHRNSRGEEMNFDDMPYLYALYLEIGDCHRYVVEKAVQTGLSEMFLVQSHSEADQGLTVMYALPKYELRNRFVNNRVYKLHSRVDYYKTRVKQTGKAIHRTSLMHYGKGTLAYVGSNVEDEFIEMPVDSAYVDERDRCNQKNLLLLPDRYSASPYQYHREISNPTVEGFGIDERYLESSQGLWKIKCEHCGKWFVMDWFQHVVRETGPNIYMVRDPEYIPYTNEPRVIHDCGKPIDRLADGEWADAYKDRTSQRGGWTGRRLSRIYNKNAKLSQLFNKWVKAQGNDMKVQVFYNSDLGLPFSSAGAKITRGMLLACCRPYDWPMSPGKTSNTVIMGVDIGADLNIVIRDVVRQGGATLFRLLAALTVPNFKLLGDVIEEWKPRFTVVDAFPEIHKVMELKAKFHNVYSSKFQHDLRKVSINRDERELSMDRTALLDYIKQGFDTQSFLLPMAVEHIDGGAYVSQLLSSTRILEVDEKNPDKSRFEWVHAAADHYFLADAYCFQAGMLLPNMDIFEFYAAEATRMEAPSIKEIKGLSEEERKELERLQGMDAQSFLAGLQRQGPK